RGARGAGPRRRCPCGTARDTSSSSQVSAARRLELREAHGRRPPCCPGRRAGEAPEGGRGGRARPRRGPRWLGAAAPHWPARAGPAGSRTPSGSRAPACGQGVGRARPGAAGSAGPQLQCQAREWTAGWPTVPRPPAAPAPPPPRRAGPLAGLRRRARWGKVAARGARSRWVCSLCSTSRRLVPALGALGSRQKHSLPDLPYDYGALEPHINAQIMQLHHSKHHAAYVSNLNVAEEKYREALEKGELLEAIKRDFGSFAKFKEKLTAVSVGVQGSGWGWLGFNKEQGRLQIAACSNQDPLQGTTGLIPLLGIDVWEHAYYLQYKNVRPDYLKAIWNVINWENVTARYTACSK
uniref:superoxide dismutase n=1 Tax=Moschus moschiferus TaxID=68415 RepID=A0A8C6CLX7_MOSMO